jgi:hypothetical protein
MNAGRLWTLDSGLWTLDSGWLAGWLPARVYFIRNLQGRGREGSARRPARRHHTSVQVTAISPTGRFQHQQEHCYRVLGQNAPARTFFFSAPSVSSASPLSASSLNRVRLRIPFSGMGTSDSMFCRKVYGAIL